MWPSTQRGLLALGDNAVFLGELVGGLLEGLLALEEAGAGLAAQLEKPVLRKGLGEGEVLLLRTGPALLAADRGGAPPVAAIAAAIELNLAAEDTVIGLHRHGSTSRPPGLGERSGRRAKRVSSVLGVLAREKGLASV